MVGEAVFIDFLQSVAVLVALVAAQWLFFRRFRSDRIFVQIASGILFGTAAIATMLLPATLAPGVILDARTAVLSIGALFGGPIVAGIAGIMTATERLALGGAGAPVGVATIAVAIVAGLLLRNWRRHEHFQDLRVHDFVGLGVVTSGISIGLVALVPGVAALGTWSVVALPYVAVLTLATVILGLVLQEVAVVRDIEGAAVENRQRFERLFQHASVAIWEEDFSELLRKLKALRAAGVTDLRRHLASNPGVVRAMAATIRVRSTNAACVALFRATSQHDLVQGIDRTWGDGADQVFVDGLCAIWNGEPTFSAAANFRTLDGHPIRAVVSYPIPKTEESARLVPVSIVDVTKRYEIQQQLIAEQKRLQEIVWATNAGTWEWNVQTGETRVNDQWFGAIGYTPDELTPLSRGAWRKLYHPGDLEKSDMLMAQALSGEKPHYEFEARIRHKLGHWLWIADRGMVVERDEHGAPRRMSGITINIDERKKTEARLSRMVALRSATLRAQGDFLAAATEEDLFRDVCENLVRARDYALVWIGLPLSDSERTIKPVAWAGVHGGYVEQLRVRWGDDELSRGPSGMAVKTARTQILRDLAHAPAFAPWANLAESHALQALTVVPVIGRDGVLAVLSVYSTEADSFDEEEGKLLLEFTGSIAAAIETLRAEQDNRRISEALGRSALTAVKAISKTIEKRDPYTAGHQERVSTLATAIAARLGWTADRIEGIRLGAIIHDIGKIYVPAEILSRPGRLSVNEMAIVKAHPSVGGEILDGVEFPWPIRDMVEQHHERLDGSGYPKGLKGDSIIEEAKVLAVADVVEAIASHRPYRAALGIETGLAEIEKGRGTLYDPVIADACIALFRQDGFQWDARSGHGA